MLHLERKINLSYRKRIVIFMRMDERNVRKQKSRGRKTKIRKRRIRLLCCIGIYMFCIVMLCMLCKVVFGSNTNSDKIVKQVESVGISKSEVAGEKSAENYENTESINYEELLAVIQASSVFPERLVEFAQKNEEAIGYVYNYPVNCDKTWEIDLEDEVDLSEIPLFIQWDNRWGYEEYGDGLMGYTGCGPTCLSMVAIHYLENLAWTPLAVAEFADKGGYYCEGSGTYWTLMSEGARELGLHSEEVGLLEENMLEVLQDGKSMIAVVGPGDFTDSGHFIVITGHEMGGFTVNDPNSYVRSSELWDFETLRSQIKGMWAIW